MNCHPHKWAEDMTSKPDAERIAERVRQSRENYRVLCAMLSQGNRGDQAVIEATLAAAGKTWRDLAIDVLVGNPPALPPGTPCPVCSTPLRVYSSRRARSGQVQYIGCPECDYRPHRNKIVVPHAAIRRRRRKRRGA